MKRLAGLALCLACGCSTLFPESDICPPGRGPSPLVDHAQPVAGGENHPVAVAISGGAVLWIDQGPPGQDVSEGSVVSLSLCTGEQRVLARQQSRPTSLVVANEIVYWVNAGLANGTGEVWRMPIGGPEGTATRLAVGEERPSAVVVEDDFVYWADRGDLDANGVVASGTGRLRRLARSTGAIETLVAHLDAPSALSVRSGVLVWGNQGTGALLDLDPKDGKTELVATYAQASGAVYRLDTGSAIAPTLLAGQQDSPLAVAQDAQRTYWLNRGLYRGSGSLQRSDGPQLVGGLDFPGGMAVDGDRLYLAVTGASDEHEEGHILRQGLDGQSIDIASSQQLPMAIATNGHLVYWVNFGDLTTTNGQVVVSFK